MRGNQRVTTIVHTSLFVGCTVAAWLALYFAWAGSVSADVLVALLVLSTWFTLFVGFTVALVRLRGRPKARAPLAHPTSIHDDVHDIPSADARLRIVR